MPLRAHTTTTSKCTVANTYLPPTPPSTEVGPPLQSPSMCPGRASRGKHEWFSPSLVSQHQASAVSTTLHIPHGSHDTAIFPVRSKAWWERGSESTRRAKARKKARGGSEGRRVSSWFFLAENLHWSMSHIGEDEGVGAAALGKAREGQEARSLPESRRVEKAGGTGLAGHAGWEERGAT